MLHFHIWCSLKEGAAERDFCARVQELFSKLHAHELIEGYAITRRELVLAPPALGTFHFTVECASTDQMNRALAWVSTQAEDPETGLQDLSETLRSLSTAVYRDYPERPPKRPRSL